MVLTVEQILREMCFNYLPFDFRFFCVDYFDIILKTMPRGFAARAMDSLGISSVRCTDGAPAES